MSEAATRRRIRVQPTVKDPQTMRFILEAPVHDSASVCYDDANYRADCSDCYTTGADWDACDSDGGTSYSADGICITGGTCDETGEACYDGTDYQSDCTSCGKTVADDDACDSDITGGAYAAEGVCVEAGADDACDTDAEVCSGTGATGTLYGDCSNANCGFTVADNDACDSDGGTAYITDIGMTGAFDSIIGMRKDRAAKLHIKKISDIVYLEDMKELNQDIFIDDLKRIHSSGHHLLELINDVLDLSKIEAGKVDLNVETFTVSALLEEVVHTAQSLVDKKGNRLEVVEQGDALGEMQSDQTRIRQVLFNLLSNAAKFTENGVITLTAMRETLDERDWLVFAVNDTGIGMNREQLERIFEEFGQAETSTTSKYGGTGLGLTISRKFCQMMRGDISVQSVPGEGSTFTVRLPTEMRRIQRGEADDPAILSTVDQAGMTAEGLLVLVIDDEAHARDLMTRHLLRAGYQVALAENGREGLELARKLKPVAITLDVLMPEMDGWAVLQALKTDPELAQIPVVMCTVVDDEQHGFSLGVTDYLTKPVDTARLLQAINRLCPDGDCQILVVEDDAAQRHLISQELKKVGWAVREAEHGRAALELLEDRTADIILLDLEMPEMDGFEFVEALQANPSWQEIPIMVLTSKDLDKTERARLNGYVQAIFGKGEHGSDQLIRQLHNVLRKSKSAR